MELGGAGKGVEKPKCAWHQPRVDSSHFEKTLFVFPRFYVFNVFLRFSRLFGYISHTHSVLTGSLSPALHLGSGHHRWVPPAHGPMGPWEGMQLCHTL